MFSDAIITSAVSRQLEINERENSEISLFEFLKRGWRYIDPSIFVDGWHLEAIAEHLQAVTDGQIRRLVINIPPRASKSSLCSVAWPAWTWAQGDKSPLSGPQVQFLTSSYAYTLSLRDSVKTRRLIQSAWYQKLWGDRFQLTGDVNTKGRFENDRGGYRLATSVDGTTTGEGGDIILVDDANNATEIESDLVRESTNLWWDEAMSTRLNDLETGAYVVIQQRLHQEDLTGHILTREADNWVHLMLPMEHDVDRHCVTTINGEQFWEDPRKEDGELLCPKRFSYDSIRAQELRLGPFAAAGQFQQSPTPRGGGIIKEEWWNLWENPKYPPCDYVIASLDTAYTEKTENDASALTLWGYFKYDPMMAIPQVAESYSPQVRREFMRDFYRNVPPKVILLYGWQERLSINDLVQKVIDTCTIDQRATKVKFRFPVDRLLVESKAAGISVAQEIHRLTNFHNAFSVELFDPRKYGDKVARAYAVQGLFSSGMIYVPWVEPNGYKWATDIIDQVSIFPRGSHDDFVDSMTQALIYLRDHGMALRREEHEFDMEAEKAYSSRLPALYPA